jgi:hypothetical protein
MQEFPNASTGATLEVAKIKRVVASRGLVGAANNTKWNELLTSVREMQGWRPSYRTKVVEGHVSSWDTEWFYRLPFPLVCVEWLDIGLREVQRGATLAQSVEVNHTEKLVSLLQRIGFEFEVRSDVARVWGYLPKSMEDFPPH